MRKEFEDDTPAEVRPSRTQKKKAAEALQKIGERLLELKEAQLKDLALPAELQEALAEARKMGSHGARRRQLQFIGSLMRQVDAARIENQLEQASAQAQRESRAFKLAERWRDELAAGDQTRLAWLESHFEDLERAELRRLVDEARRQAAGRSRPGRALFRFLRPYAEKTIS